MNEKISIIIPCYNAGKTLARTLNSVREQDYKNLEVVIVNDGSADDTLQVANKYAGIDPRFKVINQKNAGVSVARNNGLKNITGNYVVFLDADDNYTHPFVLSNMAKELERTGADMVVCNFTHPCFEQYLPAGVYDMTDDNLFMVFYQDFFAHGVPWNKITRRKCLTEEFVVGVKFNEDELFNLDNLHNIKKIALIDEVYHNYYCAPYNPNAEASAVNSLYSADKFWEKKCTIWHMGMKNYPYRVKSITKFFPEKLKDMQYVRCFDFFFWDFVMMAKNRVKEDYIACTLQGIFEEELFQQTIKDKERFGLKLKNFTVKDINEFTRLAYYAFRDIKSYNKKLSMDKVLFGIFAKTFYDLTGHVNTIDIMAASYMNLISKSTAEGRYTSNLFEMREMEKEENGYPVCLLENNMESWLKLAGN